MITNIKNWGKITNINKARQKKKYPIKYHVKIKHPTIILDEYDHDYEFARLTSNEYKDRKTKSKNTLLNVNPNRKAYKNNKSYLQKPIRIDKKNLFRDSYDSWEIDKSDYKAIEEFIKKYKKK